MPHVATVMEESEYELLVRSTCNDGECASMARQEPRGQVLEVKDQIISCRACSLSEDATPVPYKGASIAKLAVLGESPNKASQEIMEDLLKGAGLNPKHVSYMNVVSCPCDGAPSRESVEACSVNVQMQLDLIEPTYLILAGGVPLQSFKSHLKIAQMRGRAFLIKRNLLGFAIYSPMYVMRKGGSDSQTGKLVLNDLLHFKKTFYDKEPMSTIGDMGDTCIMDDKDCERDEGVAYAGYIADDGLPWCVNHMELGKR